MINLCNVTKTIVILLQIDEYNNNINNKKHNDNSDSNNSS